MRTAFFTLSLFAVLFSSATAADEKPKPNTLTAKEIADGWILLFDGETTFGWESNRELKAGQELKLGGGDVITTKAAFCDFELAFEFTGTVEADAAYVEFAGKALRIGSQPQKNDWYQATCNVGCKDGRISASMTIRKSDESGGEGSGFGGRHGEDAISIRFGVTQGKEGVFSIRSVKLRPKVSQAVAIAKDLAAWKEIPDKKSKFAVTDKGELNIKDGPGDIQSVDQYDDFILQLDIISNGDKLNSGVFFRCLPGEFWSGYEAQIRNEWVSEVTMNDGTKLTGSYTEKGDQVELKICEVKDKKVTVTKEVKKFAKSEAKEVNHRRDLPIDFGTGGVYNQQPARKVVPNDREWFTMTVIAHGNHIAVWVNGYQVSDFTDTRPADKSARKGAKTDKGPISLQGHDPTTDLSFRNIRIAELPKGEKK